MNFRRLIPLFVRKISSRTATTFRIIWLNMNRAGNVFRCFLFVVSYVQAFNSTSTSGQGCSHENVFFYIWGGGESGASLLTTLNFFPWIEKTLKLLSKWILKEALNPIFITLLFLCCSTSTLFENFPKLRGFSEFIFKSITTLLENLWTDLYFAPVYQSHQLFLLFSSFFCCFRYFH